MTYATEPNVLAAMRLLNEHREDLQRFYRYASNSACQAEILFRVPEGGASEIHAYAWRLRFETIASITWRDVSSAQYPMHYIDAEPAITAINRFVPAGRGKLEQNVLTALFDCFDAQQRGLQLNWDDSNRS